MAFEDMCDQDQREIMNLRKLLYRACRELGYIESMTMEPAVRKEHQHLIWSSEGKDVMESGMKLLGVSDLSYDELPTNLVKA